MQNFVICIEEDDWAKALKLLLWGKIVGGEFSVIFVYNIIKKYIFFKNCIVLFKIPEKEIKCILQTIFTRKRAFIYFFTV